MSTKRLDVLLFEQGMVSSRSKAKDEIEAGRVWVNGACADKPAVRVRSEALIEIRDPTNPWVSRGGLKLAHALQEFGVSVAHKTVLDVGASTGGFTQVCLTSGARKIYAVDVGTEQLHVSLRDEAKIVFLEQTDCRQLSRDDVPDPIDVIVCDVSFISFAKALTVPLSLASETADLIALVKPQFEVGPGKASKSGVVADAAQHARVCDAARRWLDAQDGWESGAVIESPIQGRAGNTEFLLHGRKAPRPNTGTRSEG